MSAAIVKHMSHLRWNVWAHFDFICLVKASLRVKLLLQAGQALRNASVRRLRGGCRGHSLRRVCMLLGCFLMAEEVALVGEDLITAVKGAPQRPASGFCDGVVRKGMSGSAGGHTRMEDTTVRSGRGHARVIH